MVFGDGRLLLLHHLTTATMVYEILVAAGHSAAAGVRGGRLFAALDTQSEQLDLALLRSVLVRRTGAVVRGGRARRLRQQSEHGWEYVLVRAGQ